MSERAVIGGITYETVGTSTAPLLLKCNGTAKLQYGQLFLDLTKVVKSGDKSEFVRGMIIMYSGLSTVPEGWAICDGNSYTYKGVTSQTPNLINCFIRAVGSTAEVKAVELPIINSTESEMNCYLLIFIMKL